MIIHSKPGSEVVQISVPTRFHPLSHSVSRWFFVTIKHSISIVFGTCQVAVSEINYTDEISQCHQEILASGLSPPQREGSAIFFWTQKLWASD